MTQEVANVIQLLLSSHSCHHVALRVRIIVIMIMTRLECYTILQLLTLRHLDKDCTTHMHYHLIWLHHIITSYIYMHKYIAITIVCPQCKHSNVTKNIEGCNIQKFIQIQYIYLCTNVHTIVSNYCTCNRLWRFSAYTKRFRWSVANCSGSPLTFNICLVTVVKLF